MYEVGLVIYVLAILAACYITRDTYKHRFLPIARPLMVMSIVLILSCLIRFIQLTDPELNQWLAQALEDIGYYLLLPLYIPLWIWMLLEYYQDRKIPPTHGILPLFYIQPVIVITLVLINIMTHGFLSTDPNTLLGPADRLGGYEQVRYIYGAIMIISILLVTVYMVKKRQQSPFSDLMMVTLTLAIPYGLHVLYKEGVTSLPLGIPAFVFFIFWGTRQYRLLDVMPVALQGIMDKMDSGILVGNKNSKLLYVNNYAQRLFKLEVSESALQQRELSMPEVFEQHFDFSKAENQTALMATQSQDHGDETRYINAILQPIFSPKLKHHLGSTISLQDITERRQAELELERYNQQKSEFFAGISHEFRTPLTLSLGNIDDVLNDLPKAKPAQLKAPLQQAKANNQRLLGLVNQLLELSRLDKGSLTIKPTQIPLSIHLPMLLAHFESLAEKQQIKLQFTVTPEAQQDATVWFDPDAFDKVVMNLVSNALKSISDHASGEVNVGLSTIKDEQLQLTVRDSGCGIPAAALPNIFDMFYSHQMDNTAWPPGTGVGLSLVKQLLVMHGAEIDVSSVEGEGSCFTVTLQRGYSHFAEGTELVHDLLEKTATGEQYDAAINLVTVDPDYSPALTDGPIEQAPSIIETQSPGESAAHVLLVEDNPDMRRYIRKHLRTFRLTEAENGEQGLELARQLMPDLVLSDIMMPKMNGYDLCQQLKSDAQTSHIPVVLLTAKSDQSEKLEGLTLGADDYLSKPFDVKELNLRINNLVKARRTLREFYRANGLEKVISHPDLPKRETEFLDKLRQYVHDNIDNAEIKVADLATVVHMSERSLSRKVKGLTGDTPKQMLLTIRLEQAARLLRSSNEPITNLSYDVGFSDASHFTRCFKKHYKMTPTEYRENG